MINTRVSNISDIELELWLRLREKGAFEYLIDGEYVDIRNISTQDLIKIRDKSLEEEYKLNLQDYDF